MLPHFKIFLPKISSNYFSLSRNVAMCNKFLPISHEKVVQLVIIGSSLTKDYSLTLVVDWEELNTILPEKLNRGALKEKKRTWWQTWKKMKN